jgi:hypothetical protein
MIQNLNIILESAAGLATITALTMLLPALIELKNPKDCGPRQIKNTQPPNQTPITSIENEQKTEKSSTPNITQFLESITDLEAQISL